MKKIAWLVAAALMLPATGAFAAGGTVVSKEVSKSGSTKTVKKVVTKGDKTKIIDKVVTTTPSTPSAPVSVPEPMSAALLGGGLLALGLLRRKA
ncbi:MAG: PEP-CTERM sorting domain-containing protein [Solirubrobacterales bacterium]